MNLQAIIAELLNHLRGMWRFRWFVVGISWAFALIGWYFVYSMPNVFAASARVSVDINRLLPALTKGLTASENVLSEVALVSKALLTRPNLERVARETDLDLRARSPAQMESLITGLQRRVQIKGGRDNIFNITYEDRSRDKAREVVAALLNSFVESSLVAQGDDSDISERVLASEIKNHEDRLLKAEADRADFQKRNIGYMPNNGADYYSRLQTALGNVSKTENQLALLRSRRDEISRQLEGEEPVFGIMSTSYGSAIGGCSWAANISKLQGDLAALQIDFTDKHPRILMLRDTISALEQECTQEKAAMGGAISAPVGPGPLELNPVYQNLRLQRSNAEVELASLQEEFRSRQRAVARLRADVDKIAEVEAELKRLNRDYSVVSGRHQELLKRWESLQSKRRLDPMTDSVQFNILEPPYASAIPVAPNRPVLLTMVLIFALGAGAAAAFGLNQLKPVFYSRRSVTQVAGLPVLGAVSMIVSPDELSRMRYWSVAWLGANVGLVVATVFVIVLEERASAFFRVLSGGAGV